jgi:hypothetical protein
MGVHTKGGHIFWWAFCLFLSEPAIYQLSLGELEAEMFPGAPGGCQWGS